jgi:hypothetical protein
VDDPVLQPERRVDGGRLDGRADLLLVLGMDDREDRAVRAGQEVGRRVARDALDLVADQLERVPGVPGGAVDRARHVDHQRAQQGVVGALLGGAQAGPGAGQQLGARERAVQVVVGARVERRVGRPAPRLDGDGQHPRLLEARVLAQRAADTGGIEATRLAVDDDQVDRLGVEQRAGVLDAPHRLHEVPGGPQPRLDLRLGGADQQHAGLAASD